MSGLPPDDPAIRDAASKKIAAGICGILLGGFGVHKFVLGMTSPGVIMLVVSLASLGLAPCVFFVSSLGAVAMHVIGVVEGIIYLTKSDQDFYQTYIVEKKEWF